MSSLYDDSYAYKTSGIDAILWLFLGLGLGLITMQILNRRNSFFSCIPYTVVIFVFGILFALYLTEREDESDTIDISLESWLLMNPDLMLFVFLPPLIFGEAMRQNMFFFNKAIGQSFLLAFPGVIINAILIAGFSKAIVPSWSFSLCCLFGSILSATDTVSVVSILHSAAASPKSFISETTAGAEVTT
jgi:NhaP-type Na+/H+ or K+/H+ antiporter